MRGIPLPTTGVLLALPGVVGLLSVPLAGVLIDRLGPRLVLCASLLLQAVADVMVGTATTVPHAAAALVLLGLGLGRPFPPASALLTGVVAGNDAEARAFGLQFTLLNASIGGAALTAAAVVDVHRPATFAVLYLPNALMARSPAPAPAPAPVGGGRPPLLRTSAAYSRPRENVASRSCLLYAWNAISVCVASTPGILFRRPAMT
ncbi:MAG: major facilitator superfamily 1 [Frankiales bacterium]|nr:major facilitator superfamily 1 [Frankiales bacterium]